MKKCNTLVTFNDTIYTYIILNCNSIK